MNRRLLPQGGSLPEEHWRSRHRAILILLWAHVIFIFVFAHIRQASNVHAVVESSIVALLALGATAPRLSRRMRVVAASVGLLSSSAIIVHLSGGVIEAHFHFFVMVAVVALYQDWVPFIAAVGYVLLHHGLVGVLDPTAVYNHPAALSNPWTWAGIHALFIFGMSAVCLVTWRMNEQILDQRRKAEERLEVERKIVETLNDVGKTLAAELDLQSLLQKVTDAGTRLTAAQFGAFFYNVVDERGESYLLYSLSGADPEAFSNFPMPRNTAIFAPTFAGEAPVRLDDVTRDPRYGKNAPRHGIPEGHLPVRSYLAVPVASRGKVHGGLFFGHAEVGVFTEHDERIAVGIAAHAAVAIDNAELYAAQRGVAETLQHSLLLDDLPKVPGIAASASYLPGGPGVEVGGDWYDLFELPEGKLALAMGDVAGRGVPAASLMGQLRNALRAYALEGGGPADVMQRLNRTLIRLDVGHMATLFYGVLDLETLELVWSSAGHPPPLMVTEHQVTVLEADSGIPLGAMSRGQFSEHRMNMSPGSTLVTYTDGLVEDCKTPFETGLSLLQTAVHKMASADVKVLIEHSLGDVLPGRKREDDVAIMAIRVLPIGDRISLSVPVRSNSLRALRAYLRRWMRERGVERQDEDEVMLAAGEAFSNAIVHSTVATSEFQVDGHLDGSVLISVTDPGAWTDPAPTSNGRGMNIIRECMDEVEIVREDDQTQVKMRRDLARHR